MAFGVMLSFPKKTTAAFCRLDCVHSSVHAGMSSSFWNHHETHLPSL
jgi:hypothetical protein